MPAVYNGCKTVPEVGSSKATLGNFEGRYPRGNACIYSTGPLPV